LVVDDDRFVFFIFVEGILVGGFAKDFGPFGRIEVRKVLDGSRDGSEPIVEDDVELRGDIAG
jgi:hypothetical protein